MMIDTIIFDIGGVLWHPSPKPLSDKWAERCGLEKVEFDQIVFNSPLYEAAATGKISNDTLWADRNEQLKLSSTELAELRTDSWDGYWDDELLAFIQALKPDYKLGILSDASSGARESVLQWINSDLFDAILFSYEAGMMKPNPEIYRRVLGMLGGTAVSTLFIDDRPKNIQAALDLGMSSFQYTSAPETITQIQQILGQQ
ncbi:MAG: HAD family phosphatase [Chloroflexi bacterium]|nr:HAD family phosphatase [Chloroflexota bacterium]